MGAFETYYKMIKFDVDNNTQFGYLGGGGSDLRRGPYVYKY